MPELTVQDCVDGKQDLDSIEGFVNSSDATVSTRLGGNKPTYSALVGRISHGDITTYSAATTYTEITDWVEESGIVYRPIPSQLPIGPESFDSAKWEVAAGYKLGDRLHPSVDNYAQLRALSSAGIPDGTVITVTDDGIAGDFAIKSGTVTDNGGTLIVFADDSSRHASRLYGGAVCAEWFGLSASNTAAINTGILQGIFDDFSIIYIQAGTFLINSEIEIKNDNTHVRGFGRDVTTIKCDTGYPQENLFTASGVDGIQFSSISLDMDNTNQTCICTNTVLENALNFIACQNIHIHHDVHIKNPMNVGIKCDGSPGTETNNIILEADISNGCRGGVQMTRYITNVTCRNMILTDTVNTAISPAAFSFDKSIGISGAVGASIYNCKSVQTNSEGGTLIVEYDLVSARPSSNVRIYNNTCFSAGGGANIKVGASNDVRIYNNHCIVADNGAPNIFLEGVYDFDVYDNYCKDADEAAIVLSQDLDTSRISERGSIRRNTLIDCNQGGNSLGNPVSGGASNFSFAVRAIDFNDVSFEGNFYIDSSDAFNGMLISGTNYRIIGENFNSLHPNRITIDNHFASASTVWQIKDCVRANTIDSGEATISQPSNSVSVSPEILNQAQTSITLVTPKTGLAAGNNDVAYAISDPGVPPAFTIIAYDSDGGTPTLDTDITFYWQADSSRAARGIFGKTML